MILWTIQPKEVFDLIQREGVYRCDIHKSGFEDFADMQYSWMVSQMKKRIGPPPEGVSYPVWAWYQWREDRKKPDLRWERCNCGRKGEKFYRLEIEIPDEQVLLSDFDNWHVPLNNALFTDSDDDEEYDDEEYDKMHKFYESLSPEEQETMRTKNWEKVFDIKPGTCTQGPFWELRKEQIRKATMFISAFVYHSRIV